MAKAMCLYALNRVIAYLEGYGIEPEHEVCQKALRLVDCVMSEGSDQLVERAIDRIPDFFELPELTVPAQSPPMIRGSIGYHDHA
ncbi:MAG: hypothetical protein KGY54_08325 [Oleiphilaceae bacterium]|nr:hypothetical protein [Oleiphilaceae bacterium]